MGMVIPEHHSHVLVSRDFRQLMGLEEISQAGSRFMPQVMEVKPAQTSTLASTIESLGYRVGL